MRYDLNDSRYNVDINLLFFFKVQMINEFS